MSSIRLTVLWPQGTVLPVRIRRGAKASELFELLKFSVASGFEMYLIYKGFILNPNETLESQLIEDNSTLNVEFVPEGVDFHHEWELYKIQTKMQDIYEENLRLNDVRYAMIEGHPTANLTYEEILRLEQSEEQSDEEPEEPTIIAKPDKIATEPLPVFWLSPLTSESNLYDSLFDSQCPVIADAETKKNGSWSW